jgi:hypothetical protein
LHQWNGPAGLNPTWSPDGTRIAFESSGGIFVANADGSAAEPLSVPPTGWSDGFPAWSPDGASIAFVRHNGTGVSDLYAVGADGAGLRPLTTVGDAYDPSWSPDGTKLVFDRRGGGGGSDLLYEVNADGTGMGYLVREPGTIAPVVGTMPSWGSSTTRPAVDPPTDTTPPTIELRAPADGASYELGERATAAYSCSDDLSGIASCSGPVPNSASFDTSRLGSYSFQVTATDKAGHLASKTVTYTVADRTSPTVTITSPIDGFVYDMGGRAYAIYACGDLSGIATCSGPVPHGTLVDTSRAGSYTFRVNAVDKAGNIGSASVSYTVTDRTPPAITIRTPIDGTVYLLGADVRADYFCADEPGGSGLRTCDAASLDTTSVGRKTFSVTATDNAANTARASRSYSVIYAFDGFYSPTATYPTATSTNAGQSAKVRFTLHGDQGLDVLAAGSPVWTPCDGGAATPSTGTLTYQTAQDRYAYEATTPKSWAGTCRDLILTLRDGTVHKARFQFDK